MTQEPQQLSDADLIQLANDITVTADDLALLTPAEAQRFAKLRQSTPAQEQDSSLMGMLGGAINMAEDFSRGAFKGAGESAFHLGSAVRQIPGIGHATDALAKLVGPEGTNPEQAFAQVPQELEAQNSAENAGKIIEQIAEFFLPAGKAGVAAQGLSGATDLVLKLPKAASTARRMATNAAWKGSKVAGDALSAGAVSALHGDDDPQYAAAGSAGGALTGKGAAELAKLLSTKTGQQLGPIIAAMAAMGGLGALSGGTLGAGFGALGGQQLATNTVFRAAARRMLQAPGAVGRAGWAAEQGGEKLGTAAAGVIDQARKTKRRSAP
jgi:hypothetical protein